MLSVSEREAILASLTEQQLNKTEYDWNFWGRPNQQLPGSIGASQARKDWRFWVLCAGRGFGKTLTGAQACRKWAEDPKERILMIAPTASDVREVMIEGPAGLMQCYPPGERPEYNASRHLITFPSGAIGITRTAEEPERLRGPEFRKFWADEMCAWQYIDAAWDQIMFGFRRPDAALQGIITTTPKPLKTFKRLIARPSSVVTRGSSYENRANLSEEYFREVIQPYEGTRLGRQEIHAEILEDLEGALWTRHIIDANRVTLEQVPPLVRVVVAIDPAVTANEDSDETGIGCVGLGHNGHLYVLQDVSQRSSPNQWARAACALFLKWDCDRMVAEVNNGGDLVEMNLRAIHPAMPYRSVRASRGKAIRAEPAAALYERGLVHHVKHPDANLEGLEDQLCSFVPGISDGHDDRLDWLTWACHDLIIQPQEQYSVSVLAGRDISPY